MSFIHICTLLHKNPLLNFHHFEKCTLFIFHNITLCSSYPNRNKARIIWLDKNKILIIKMSKQGVCSWRPHVFWPTIKALNWVLWINTNNNNQQWSLKVVGSTITWRPNPSKRVALSQDKGLNKCSKISSQYSTYNFIFISYVAFCAMPTFQKSMYLDSSTLMNFCLLVNVKLNAPNGVVKNRAKDEYKQLWWPIGISFP